MSGWTETILHIDLGMEKVDHLSTKTYAKRFLGGLGVGQKIYWDQSSPGVDALHPDNPLIFMTGPLTATGTPAASRLSVCGKSPALYPESFASGNLGGFFAHQLKRSGFDGIVVRGAKAHQTGSLSSHEIIVLPTRALKKGDEDYAVAFAIPSDSPGLIHVVGRSSLDNRELDGCDIGNIRYSKYCPTVIFDNVFVPWDRVFLAGEYQHGGVLALLFALFHRHSYSGCKPALGDVLLGTAPFEIFGTLSFVVERDGPVTTVILNRPGKRNAVDDETAAIEASTSRSLPPSAQSDSSKPCARHVRWYAGSGRYIAIWARAAARPLSGSSVICPRTTSSWVIR